MTTRSLTKAERAALAPDYQEAQSHRVRAQYHDMKAQEALGRVKRLSAALFGQGALLDMNTLEVTIPDIVPGEGFDGNP